MNANGVVVRNNRVNLTPTVSAFFDLAVKNQPAMIAELRQHLLEECWEMVESSPDNRQQMFARDIMLSTGYVEITDEQSHMAIYVASILENTHRLDEDAKLIVEHHVYLGTQDEIAQLARYLIDG